MRGRRGGGWGTLVLARREDEGHGLALISNILIASYMRKEGQTLREEETGSKMARFLHFFKNTSPLAIFRQTS